MVILKSNSMTHYTHLLRHRRQEGRAVTGNHSAMRGTCTESLNLILEQRSEQHYWQTCRKLAKKTLWLQSESTVILRYVNG